MKTLKPTVPKSRIFACCIAMQTFIAVHAQEYSDLTHLRVGETEVYHSRGEEISGTFSGGLCAGANAYFAASLDRIEVPFNLLVLSEADWSRYTNPQLVYGMPHYKGDGITLVVAAEDNQFWRLQVPDPATVPAPYNEFIPMVYNLNGQISGRYFFDLLAVHELSHAWHWAGKLNTQRMWLSELFCNIMLHTYIAEERTELLAALEVLPAYWSGSNASGLKYTTLKQFEEDYNALGLENPFNYGWYQFRFHNAAKLLYDEAGPEVTKKLWDFLKNNPENLSDDELVALLEKEVHPFLAELVRNW